MTAVVGGLLVILATAGLAEARHTSKGSLKRIAGADRQSSKLSSIDPEADGEFNLLSGVLGGDVQPIPQQAPTCCLIQKATITGPDVGGGTSVKYVASDVELEAVHCYQDGQCLTKQYRWTYADGPMHKFIGEISAIESRDCVKDGIPLSMRRCEDGGTWWQVLASHGQALLTAPGLMKVPGALTFPKDISSLWAQIWSLHGIYLGSVTDGKVPMNVPLMISSAVEIAADGTAVDIAADETDDTAGGEDGSRPTAVEIAADGTAVQASSELEAIAKTAVAPSPANSCCDYKKKRDIHTCFVENVPSDFGEKSGQEGTSTSEFTGGSGTAACLCPIRVASYNQEKGGSLTCKEESCHQD